MVKEEIGLRYFLSIVLTAPLSSEAEPFVQF